VPRIRRSTVSAFTRVFDALWWCAADPEPKNPGPGQTPVRDRHCGL